MTSPYLERHVRTYRQVLSEQKERAFLRWMNSGYRDVRAHREYIRLYEELTKKARPNEHP